MTESLPFQITIARQLGSGGAELGQRIACRLGFGYLDRQILEYAAQELEMNENELVHREERVQSFWTRMLETFSAGCPEYISSAPPLKAISDDRLIEAEQRVLLRLAEKGSCVIVGRCGFHLLKGQAPLLNVFVHAPRRFRVKRIMKFYGAENKAQALDLIDRTDRDRERFVGMVTGRTWHDARNYHLSMDLEQVGFETAEEVIVSLAHHMCREADTNEQKNEEHHAGDG